LGIIEENNIIEIHRVNCQKAIDFQSASHHRVIQAKWTTAEHLAYLAGIRVEGIDQVGLVNDITHIISQDMNVNMKSLKFDSQDGYYNGEIQAYVSDTEHLNALIKKLSKVKGVHKVERFDTSGANFTRTKNP
jgi:GTP pyrophosphokinase